MGRESWTNRITVERCLTVDVFWLRKNDYFCGFRSGGIVWRSASGEETNSICVDVLVNREIIGEEYVRFNYSSTNRVTGEKKYLDYKVQLERTPCYFGGFRYWFTCPLVINNIPCGRRVGKLYLPPGGIYFGCRHCYDLTYRSCQEHDKRVDWMRKLDPDSLKRILKSGDPKTSLLGVKAFFKNWKIF